jgi:hypothetical protein
VLVYGSSADASRAVAAEIAELIRDARRPAGETAVLGLATGSTPQAVYDELVRMHREEGLSFANVVTFNLDEYWPMPPESLQSYRRFMNEYLFDHVDIDPANAHVPDGEIPQDGDRRVLRGLRAEDPRRGRDRLPDPRHRADRAHRVQRARVGAREPHEADHARPRDADGRGERFLRRVERPAAGDHDGRRDDHGREARRR